MSEPNYITNMTILTETINVALMHNRSIKCKNNDNKLRGYKAYSVRYADFVRRLPNASVFQRYVVVVITSSSSITNLIFYDQL